MKDYTQYKLKFPENNIFNVWFENFIKGLKF